MAASLCLVAAACGDSDSSGGSASSSGGTGGSSKVVFTANPEGYVEAGGTELPGEYPEPTGKLDGDCTIGYVSPTNAIPGIEAEISGIKKSATAFGCTVVVKDGQLSPQNQVTGMQSLLAEGADAIIVNPLDPGALAAPIEEANKQDVPVIAVDSPASPDADNIAGTTSDFLQSRDVIAYAAAKAIADAKPGARVGFLYPAFPAGNLQYQVERFEYWAKELGLDVAERGEVSNDTPDAATQATNALLQKDPQIEAVMAYNDTAAASAVAAARSLGHDDLLVTGIDGEARATDLIADGRILMTWAYDNVAMGEQEGRAAIDAALGMKIPDKVTAPGAIITQENVAAYDPQA